MKKKSISASCSREMDSPTPVPPQHRANVFQAHQEELSPLKAHQKRKDASDAARKDARDRLVAAKRLIVDAQESPQSASGEPSGYDVGAIEIKGLEVALKSPHVQQRILALVKFRRYLVEPSDDTEAFVAQGDAIPILINSLNNSHNAEEQLQATWCLSTAAAGSSAMSQRALQAAPYLIAFLSSPNETLQEHAAFALGNLAGDGVECADHLMANGVAVPLLKLLESTRSAVVKTSCFAIANLLRAHSPSTCGIFARTGIFQLLQRHLISQEAEIVSEAFWVLSYFTSTSDRFSQALIQMGVFPILIGQLQQLHSRGPLCLSLIRTLGNFLCAPDDVLVSFLQHEQFLPSLANCLMSDSVSVVKETLWVFSNLTTCDPPLLSSLFQNPAILLKLAENMKSQRFDLRKEAAKCLLNVSVHGGPFLDGVLSLGILPEFVYFLRSNDSEARGLSLQFFELVLRLRSDASGLIRECGGLEELRKPPATRDEEIQMRTIYLLEKYFGTM